MSCGCDSSKLNSANVPLWINSQIYNTGEHVKIGDIVFVSKTNIYAEPIVWTNTGGPFNMGGMTGGGIFANMGQSPPNDRFWAPVSPTDCYDATKCVIAPPAPPPPPPPPTVVTASEVTNIVNEVIPPQVPTPIYTTLIPDPEPVPAEPPMTIPDLSTLVPSFNIPSLSSLNLPELPDFANLDTKHIIIGIAGVLTMVLLFKK